LRLGALVRDTSLDIFLQAYWQLTKMQHKAVYLLFCKFTLQLHKEC